MFKKKTADQISKIKTIGDNALNFFSLALESLENANEKFINIIKDESQLIEEHGANIYACECHINSNNRIINNLKSFLHEC